MDISAEDWTKIIMLIDLFLVLFFDNLLLASMP